MNPQGDVSYHPDGLGDFEKVRRLWPETQHGRWMDADYVPDLVSVIVPTYNRASLLKDALDSVWTQTYRPIELLVVDDGSNDETEELVHHWKEHQAKDDSRFAVRYLYQENSGAPAARNLGLINCQGEFVQFLDSDDVLHPQKLELQKKCLELHGDCECAWAPLEKFVEADIPPDPSYGAKEVCEAYPEAVGDNYFSLSHVATGGLFRRAVVRDTGPWMESLARWQDLEYEMRFWALHPEVVCMDAPLYFFRNHEGERINSLYNAKQGLKGGLESLQAIERVITRMENEDPELARGISNFYLSLVRQAVKFEAPDVLDDAVDGALRWRNDSAFRLRLVMLRAISNIFGGKAANLIFFLYSRMKGVSAP